MKSQIPQNWKKTELKKIARITTGSTNSQDAEENGKYPLFDRSMTIKRSNKFLFDREAVIIPGEGKEFKPRFYSGKFDLHQRAYAVYSLNEEIENKFLYYLLLNSMRYFSQFAVGSTVKSLRLPIFENLSVLLPSRVERKNIVNTLSTIDDKIEVNNKIAKTLEQMAQNIFKEWFVKFHFPGHEKVKFIDSELGKIPEGWEIKNLSKILQLKHGFAFKSEEFIQERTKFIVLRMGNFQEKGGLQFSDNTVYLKNIDNHLKYILDKEDMVMIFSDITREGRLIGNVGIIPDDENTYVLNQRVVKIEHEKKHKYFLLSLFNSKAFHKHCLSRADSATVLNLKNEHIYDYQLALLGNEVLEVFNMIVTPFYKKIENIKKESGELAAMRDLLLPKLMRGEIRV